MKKQFFLNSLRGKVLMVILGVCVPVFILMFWVNAYSVELIQQQIYENNMDILNLYMNQLDTELMKIMDYLVNEYSNRQDIEEFASASEIEKYNATISFAQNLENEIHMFRYVEGIMYYSVKNENRIYNFTDSSADYTLRMGIIEYIMEHAEEFYGGSREWKTYRINGQDVLIYAIGDENVLFSSWITYDTLLSSTMDWKLAQNSYTCFISREGELYTEVPEELMNLNYGGNLDSYYFSGYHDHYLMAGVKSIAGDFCMMNAVNRKEIMGRFYIIRFVGAVAFLCFLFLLIPFLIRFLNKSVFKPISRMEQGMERVEAGDLKVEIENDKKFTYEISHLISSFNEMVEQIESLKIQSYEDTLEKQELELDYMQLQIEPHFYLNALNLINTMAQVGDTDLIRQLTENLSLYLRYIAGARKRAVTIQEEITHNRHYLEVMKIRFGDSFLYVENIDESVSGVKVPPLLIQMLVENSIKYAFDIYGETEIIVTIQRDCQDVVIRVEDNGGGYSGEMIENFQKGIKPEENHIGLWNIRMRLWHMYQGGSQIIIRNRSPHGALTEVRIREGGNI